MRSPRTWQPKGLALAGAVTLLLLAQTASVACADVGAGTAATGLGAWLPFALILLVSLTLSAFFSGSETALVSVDRIRLEPPASAGNPRARIVTELVNNPERMLGMTLVGTNLMNVLASEFGLLMWIAVLSRPGPWRSLLVDRLGISAEVVAIAVTSILLLIFGEILPKTVSRIKANEVSLRYAPLMRLFDLFLWPIVFLVTAITRRVAHAIAQGLHEGAPGEERDSLRLLATMGEQTGGLLSNQRQMIHGVLDLRERTAGRVMVPRVHVRALPLGTTVEEVYRVAAEHGHARFPVYRDRIDEVVGIVHLLDVIYAEAEGRLPAEATIDQFVRTNISFVPESKNIYELLHELRRSRMTIAVIVDEYGGVVGIVTLEDVLEEIIGEFADERDAPSSVRVVSRRVLECDGRTELDELRERHRLLLPLGNYETIAGLVLDSRGNVPRPGDSVQVGRHTITVLDADLRTIKRVRITRSAADP